MVTDNDLFYKKNEEANIGAVICAGHVTSSTTKIQFNVQLPKKMANISTITITAGTILVRGISGYVQDSYNTPIALTGSTYTVSTVKRNDNTLYIEVAKSSAFSNVTNNTPVSVYTSGLKLKFT